MSFLTYNEKSPFSPSYPISVTVDNITYQNPGLVPDFERGLRAKYDQHGDLREGLKATKGYSLIGPSSDLLEKIRQEILEHDTVIREELEEGNFCLVRLGETFFRLPEWKDIYQIERDVYCLAVVKQEGNLVWCRENATTRGKQRYLAIYSPDGRYKALIKEAAIMVIGKEMDIGMRKWMEDFIEEERK